MTILMTAAAEEREEEDEKGVVRFLALRGLPQESEGGSPLPSPFFLTECDDDDGDDSDIEMGRRDGLRNGRAEWSDSFWQQTLSRGSQSLRRSVITAVFVFFPPLQMQCCRRVILSCGKA